MEAVAFGISAVGTGETAAGATTMPNSRRAVEDDAQAPTGLPFTPLPGRSAKTRLVLGFKLEAAGFLVGLPVVVEDVLPGRWWFWAILFGGGCLVLELIALPVTLSAYRRAKAEGLAGYATLWKDAVNDPALYFVSGDLAKVISGPHEQRPKTTRRADMQAYMKARS